MADMDDAREALAAALRKQDQAFHRMVEASRDEALIRHGAKRGDENAAGIARIDAEFVYRAAVDEVADLILRAAQAYAP